VNLVHQKSTSWDIQFNCSLLTSCDWLTYHSISSSKASGFSSSKFKSSKSSPSYSSSTYTISSSSNFYLFKHITSFWNSIAPIYNKILPTFTPFEALKSTQNLEVAKQGTHLEVAISIWKKKKDCNLHVLNPLENISHQPGLKLLYKTRI